MTGGRQDQVELLSKKDVVPLLIKLTRSEMNKIRVEAFCSIGNYAMNSNKQRDELLEMNVLKEFESLDPMVEDEKVLIMGKFFQWTFITLLSILGFGKVV